MTTDPRLIVETPHADPALRHQPARIEWDGTRNRYTVDAAPGVRVLGYIERIGLNHLGEPPEPHTISYADATTGIPRESTVVRYVYQATTRDGAKLDDPVDTIEDGAALVVGAAHSDDPMPGHVVPRSVGRPAVGKPINVRLGDELLARVDAAAEARGTSRADLIRDLVARGLESPVDA